MVDVVTNIVINKPVEIVSAYASNPDNAPEWYVNIKSADWQTPKPLQLGSRIAFVAFFMGRRIAYTYEVVEMSSNKLVMKTAQGLFPMETTYKWEAINANTTRMTLRNKGDPSGFSKLITPFISMMMRRANNKDLHLLKQVLEKN